MCGTRRLPNKKPGHNKAKQAFAEKIKYSGADALKRVKNAPSPSLRNKAYEKARLIFHKKKIIREFIH